MQTRIKDHFFIFLLILCLSACGLSGGQNKASDPRSPQGELTIFEVFQNAAENGFSGVALVQHRGEIVLHEAAGFADRELRIPNTAETVFDIASITKQYTAALIMALQEAGLLTVEDRLAKHFDNLPKDKADITIHQLLTHTSGIRRNFGESTVAIDRDIFLSLAWATQLEFKPGTKYQYSNAGYGIAAAIAETVSGQTYETALRTHILDPAKLDNTGYLLPDWSNHTLATGYRDKRSIKAMTSWGKDGPYRNVLGIGGLLTTTGDLLKWHHILSGESVLSSRSIESLQGRHVDKTLGADAADEAGSEFYGYGWNTEDSSEVGVVHWHTGHSGYFASFMGRAVEEDAVIIVLANESNDAARQLVDDFADAIVRR